MKTITFFSEKGGVGKSSFSILYASWLKSIKGVNVGVADFNHRIEAYRKSEIRQREHFIKTHPDLDVKPFDLENAWPIVPVDPTRVAEIRSSGDPYPYATWFEEETANGKLKDLDVIICDFPGNLTGNEFPDLIKMSKLGTIVIPTEKDEMTINSTLRVDKIIKSLMKSTRQEDLRYSIFINKAQVHLINFRTAYMKLASRLTRAGLPMLPDLVSYSERMLSIDKVDILRSTFGFPDFSNPEIGNNNDLGIENLFIDITKELAKSRNYGKKDVDLSFVNEMTKKKDGRQFNGSAFPEYEV